MSRKAKAGKPEYDLPKKPLNSFFLFAKDVRAETKREFPNTSAANTAKEIGKKWRALNESDKNKYKTKAKTLMKQWKSECNQIKENIHSSEKASENLSVSDIKEEVKEQKKSKKSVKNESKQNDFELAKDEFVAYAFCVPVDSYQYMRDYFYLYVIKIHLIGRLRAEFSKYVKQFGAKAKWVALTDAKKQSTKYKDQKTKVYFCTITLNWATKEMIRRNDRVRFDRAQSMVLSHISHISSLLKLDSKLKTPFAIFNKTEFRNALTDISLFIKLESMGIPNNDAGGWVAHTSNPYMYNQNIRCAHFFINEKLNQIKNGKRRWNGKYLSQTRGYKKNKAYNPARSRKARKYTNHL